MLKTRIVTAAVLACLLLAGLFLLPPAWAVAALGAVFTVGAWEWAGFGALTGAGPRLLTEPCR
jgi:phosphatidate cytidylyltransferase